MNPKLLLTILYKTENNASYSEHYIAIRFYRTPRWYLAAHPVYLLCTWMLHHHLPARLHVLAL